MEEKKNKKEFDVIFAFAFGSPADLISNHNIAERAKEARECNYLNTKIKTEDFPVVTQMDIARAKPLTGAKDIFIVDDKNTYGEFGYPSTLKLIKIFYDFNNPNKEHNWKKVLVIAAPMHAARCVRDLRKLGFDAFEDEYLKTHYNMPSIWWYHHNSTQFWTRSGLYWWPREIILRCLSCLSWKIYEWISLR